MRSGHSKQRKGAGIDRFPFSTFDTPPSLFLVFDVIGVKLCNGILT